jgi:hypothetical protein
MTSNLARKLATLACASLLGLAHGARSQEQASVATPDGASSSPTAGQAPTKAAPTTAGAEGGAAEATEALQKAVQNPVASLISLPLQNNTNFVAGPYNRAQDVLNRTVVVDSGCPNHPSAICRASPKKGRVQ